jgi:hypothetical protein
MQYMSLESSLRLKIVDIILRIVHEQPSVLRPALKDSPGDSRSQVRTLFTCQNGCYTHALQERVPWLHLPSVDPKSGR